MSMFEIHGGFTGLAASSRVRLARNIKGYPFRLTEQQHSEIADKIFAALKENPTIGPEFDKKQIIPRSTEASQLVEEHLISPELAQNGGWLIVSKDSGVSIMVGEEDHLRLQVIGTGLCPKECLETANRVASLIEAALPFAYDERLGYLTACPTNIGTGLRASIMLHLPMLTATEQMDRIIGYAGSRGCAVRGTYGEGSQAVGGFYQVSNQVTLGASAAELTDKLVETATTIIDAEKKAREQVRNQNEPALRDRIYRAAGTMKSAYLIDTSEAVQCISDVLIGLQMGFLSGMDAQKLYALEEHIRPAMLTGAPQDRDKKRAEILREATYRRYSPAELNGDIENGKLRIMCTRTPARDVEIRTLRCAHLRFSIIHSPLSIMLNFSYSERSVIYVLSKPFYRACPSGTDACTGSGRFVRPQLHWLGAPAARPAA